MKTLTFSSVTAIILVSVTAQANTPLSFLQSRVSEGVRVILGSQTSVISDIPEQ